MDITSNATDLHSWSSCDKRPYINPWRSQWCVLKIHVERKEEKFLIN